MSPSPCRWVPELRPEAAHNLRPQHVHHPVLLEVGGVGAAALQAAGARRAAAREQSAADRQQALHPQQEVSNPAENYHAAGEVRRETSVPADLFRCCRSARSVCVLGGEKKKSKIIISENSPQPRCYITSSFQAGLWAAPLIDFLGLTLRGGLLLSLQLGIMLISPTICEDFDIQPRFSAEASYGVTPDDSAAWPTSPLHRENQRHPTVKLNFAVF